MKNKHSISTHLSPTYVLLGFLAIRPSHGYEIHRRLQAELKHIWRLSLSQVYNVLTRLENEGLIDAEIQPQSDRPDRTQFQLTPSGRQVFETWLNTPIGPSVRALRMAFITKLYFCTQLSDRRLRDLFQIQETEILKGLEMFNSKLSALPNGETFNRLSLKLRIVELETFLHWLQDCRSEFHFPS